MFSVQSDLENYRPCQKLRRKPVAPRLRHGQGRAEYAVRQPASNQYAYVQKPRPAPDRIGRFVVWVPMPIAGPVACRFYRVMFAAGAQPKECHTDLQPIRRDLHLSLHDGRAMVPIQPTFDRRQRRKMTGRIQAVVATVGLISHLKISSSASAGVFQPNSFCLVHWRRSS